MSNQALGYHIGTLKAKHLIEEVQTRPVALYRLTPFGQRVKEILAQSDTSLYTKLWRCHNLILGWEIKGFGTWKFDPKRLKHMKNWAYQELVLKKHKIHVQDTGLLKVYCPEIYAEHNADEGFDKAVEIAQKVVAYIQSRYSLELGERYRIRNGQKELIGSEKLAEMIGHVKVGGVFIDISDKQNRRLEADQDNYDLEALMSLPKKIEQIVEFQHENAKITNDFAKNIELHLDVLNKQSNALEAIKSAILELKEVIKNAANNNQRTD
jgi:hypothetical protein